MANTKHLTTRSAEQQRAQLESWLETGFNAYADLCKRAGRAFCASINASHLRVHIGDRLLNYYRGEIHNNVALQIGRYCQGFSCILRGEVEMSVEDDPVQLRGDLCELMTSGCSSLHLVELLLACTSDDGIAIPDILLHYAHLRDPRRSFQGLRTAPFYSAFCYIFLKYYHHGHDTLTLLLRAMQYTRKRVPVVADYLAIRGRDRVTSVSLQRRVHRYFTDNPGHNEAMRNHLRQYLSHPDNDRKSILSTVSAAAHLLAADHAFVPPWARHPRTSCQSWLIKQIIDSLI
jgi:hypothetical protein